MKLIAAANVNHKTALTDNSGVRQAANAIAPLRSARMLITSTSIPALACAYRNFALISSSGTPSGARASVCHSRALTT